MKKIIRFLADFISFRLMKYFFTLFVFITTLSSCFQKFYDTNTVGKTDSETLKALQAEDKMFIIHTPDDAFVLKNIAVNDDVLSGNRDSPTTKYSKYLNPPSDTANNIRPLLKEMVLNEVHLYTKAVFRRNKKVNIEIGQIYRMDVYGLDEKATKESTRGGKLGITGGVGLIIGIIAVAAGGIHNVGHP